MFILEVLIYISFALFMSWLARGSSLLNKDKSQMDGYMICYILFFTIIAAIRWRVGVDSVTYIKIFQEGEVRPDSKEFLWDWLVRFVHNHGLHFVIGTATAAFLQIYLLYRSTKEYKFILIWLPIVLFGGRYFFDLMNGVRQMIAACGYVFLTRFVLERKFVHFLVGIFLLSGIHQSVLIMLPTYFFTYIPFNKLMLPNRRSIALSILLICVFVGQRASFQNILAYIEPILSITGYESHESFYANVLQGNGTERLSFGPTMISFLLCSIAAVWYGPQLKEEYETRIPYFQIWYLLAFIYSCTYFLFCNTSHMLIRPFQYFEMFQAIILSLLLHKLYTTKCRFNYPFYILILIIWTCTLAMTYTSIGKTNESILYKTYFERI